MGKVEKNTAGNRQHQPPPHPGRDFPSPAIDEPSDDPETGQPAVRDPPIHPDGDPAKIA